MTESDQKKQTLTNEFLENVLLNLSEVKSGLRQYKRIAVLVFTAVLAITGGTTAFVYYKFKSPYLAYVTDSEGKTTIGVLKASRIEANPDKATGGTMIELYHDKK